jgi:hypothetical protein
MPISSEKEWYQEAGIKKPLLQIKILRYIGLEGQLSKRMAQIKTGSDYSDVSNAIDSLLKRRMIRISSPAIAGRRDKRYYALTGKGLEAFIDESASPSSSSEEFWKAIIWYYMLNPKQVSFSDIEKPCSQFESKYLGHPAINSFLLQSQFFYKLINNWLEENFYTFDNDNTSISQIVLESIAIKRRITLQQLCKMTAESEENVKEVLDKYSAKVGCQYYYISNEEIEEEEQGEKHSGGKHPDLDHMLIVRNDISQDITYELSLFGIMLVIALIRFHYIGIDKVRLHIFNRHTDKLKLFFEDIPLEEYFDKIALNYHDKLHLIFGKWSFLKKELGTLFLYDNFDFLLYNEAFSLNMGTSIWLGGNKELCDTLQALADRSATMLKVLYIEGRDIVESFHKDVLRDKKGNESKLLPVYLKLNEIETILKYFDNRPYPNGVEEKIIILQNKIKPDLKDRNLYPDAITFIERVFSNELTFFFYLNLNNSRFTPSRNYFQNIKSNLPPREISLRDLDVVKDLFSYGSPKQRLIRIIQNDNDIRKQFCTWIRILVDYQQETSQRMIENLKMIDIEK